MSKAEERGTEIVIYLEHTLANPTEDWRVRCCSHQYGHNGCVHSGATCSNTTKTPQERRSVSGILAMSITYGSQSPYTKSNSWYTALSELCCTLYSLRQTTRGKSRWG